MNEITTPNYFAASKDHPYHVSIGAVMRNAEGKICCHHFDKLDVKSIGVFEDLYLLMRETIEPGESIEQCLHRGLMEEFGATAKLITYIGSKQDRFKIKDTDVEVEKTTLYFLCDCISQDELKRKEGDEEASSEIRWMDPAELAGFMKAQCVKYGREDADESVIVERVLNEFVN